MLKVAAFALTYAGFALLHAGAERQPLADRLQAGPEAAGFARFGPYVRRLTRLLALGCVAAACALVAPVTGWTEAILFTAVALVFVASLLVVLAAVVPRLVWGLAVVSPVLAGVLALGSRWMP
jgi:hypothetical protein